MTYRLPISPTAMWALLLPAMLLPATDTPAASVVGEVDLGYSAGLGGQVNLRLENFTRDVPLTARIALGYFVRDPGDPYAARRIFINDNTNGTPDKSGGSWQFRFDLVFPVGRIGPQIVQVFAGVRHARYTAHFDFVGGNETFDVKSNPWGLGAGVETAFATGSRSAFVLALGLDKYFDATLAGHGTSYSPAGDHVNSRDDYTYEDAREAIKPPGLEPVALAGWRLAL
jgi:hypothetical protein